MPFRATEESLTLAAVAAARRAALAREFFSDEDVKKQLGIDHQTLMTWRKSRKILSVWHAPERRYLHPPFQFVSNHLLEEIATLLRLRQPIGHDRSGWSSVEWLLSPHVLLDDHRPAEILQSEPSRVVTAAQIESSDLASGA